MSNTGLNIVLLIAGITLAGLSFVHEDTKSSLWKLFVIVIASALMFWAASEKEAIAEAREDSVRMKFNSELIARDSLNQQDNNRRYNELAIKITDAIGLKVDRLLPAIGSIRITSTKEGLLVRYQIRQPIENLRLVVLANPFDSTFDETFGDRILIPLPSRLGNNVFLAKAKEIILGEKLQLMIKGENPYVSTEIIEHVHAPNVTTDNIRITADNLNITADRQ